MVDPEIAAVGVLNEQQSAPRPHPFPGRSQSALSGHSPCEWWGTLCLVGCEVGWGTL